MARREPILRIGQNNLDVRIGGTYSSKTQSRPTATSKAAKPRASYS